MKLKLNTKVVVSTVMAFSALATTPVFASGYDYYTTYGTSDAAAATIFSGVGIIFYCCICLIPIIIGAILAYIVYKDAKKFNVENGPMWAILTFFFNVIGLLVYFLAIKPEAVRKQSGVTGAVNNVKEKVEEKVDEMKDNK